MWYCLQVTVYSFYIFQDEVATMYLMVYFLTGTVY